MILVITPENRSQYKDYLEEMHRVRYEVFVDRCGWSNLENEHRLDVDQFDKPWVTYYLKLSPEGKILAGLRTLPTNHPYMIDEVYYPMFKENFSIANLPNDEKTWEMSRYFVVDPDYRTESGHAAKMELYVAVFEHALACGVENLCAVGETYIMSRAMRLGWKLQPISIPFEHEDVDFKGEMLAINLEVNERMVAQTRSAWNLTHQVLIPIDVDIVELVARKRHEEVEVLSTVLSNQPDRASRLLALMRELASENAERRQRAEKYLDSWIARETSAVGASTGMSNLGKEQPLN